MIGSGDWAPVGFSFGPLGPCRFHYDWVWRVCWGLLDGGSRPKPTVPTMTPFPCWGSRFSPTGKREYLRKCLMWGLARKENIWDLLGMGIGEALMQGCSDVYITGEFASFLMSHLM